MPRPKRWKELDIIDGVQEVHLESWKYFHDFVRQEMLDFSYYIWRGQRDSQWTLESSLDRFLRGKDRRARQAKALAHLKKFKSSIRGRRGSNPIQFSEENEWWALGQHHGLATPLLDWTESPFVSLYFAFERPLRPSSGKRSIWALGPVEEKNNQLVMANGNSHEFIPTLNLFRPMQDENARLVAQAGLFTRAPVGDTVDDWVKTNFKNESNLTTLIKILIPEAGRSECLRTLNRMNISHLTLFPDLYGASQHCNKTIEIPKY